MGLLDAAKAGRPEEGPQSPKNKFNMSVRRLGRLVAPVSPRPLPVTLLRALGERGSMLTRTPALPGALDDAPSWSPAEMPRSGWSDLDATLPLRPGALTLLDHDGGAAADVLYSYMADAAVMGRLVLVADGANFLDVYRLATAARRRAAARLPDASRRELAAYEELVLERVRVARGFTAHQLQAIVEDGLPAQADETVGLLVAPGLLDMHLDDELSREESRALSARLLQSLRRLSARLHVPALVANRALAPTSAHPLRVLLEESVDEHVLLRHTPGGGLGIQLPRRGASFLAPAPGRTRLEDFLAPEPQAPAVRLARRVPGPWTQSSHRMMGRFGEAYRRTAWAVHEAREAA